MGAGAGERKEGKEGERERKREVKGGRREGEGRERKREDRNLKRIVDLALDIQSCASKTFFQVI